MSIRVPILTYHSIDDSGSVISTPAHKFREQMQVLQDSRFNVVSLNNLVTLVHKKQPLPGRTAVITFDDGFSNVYLNAYPVLQEFGYSATVFLVPGYIGKMSRWNAALKGLPVLDLMVWDQIKEMAGGGIDFGSHGMTHEALTKLSLEEARREIIESKLVIQDHLNQEVTLFSYPYGITNRQIKEMVQAEFQGACGTCMDFVTKDSDIYELPRIDMFYFSNNVLFKLIGTSYYSYFVRIRSILRSLRGKYSKSR